MSLLETVIVLTVRWGICIACSYCLWEAFPWVVCSSLCLYIFLLKEMSFFVVAVFNLGFVNTVIGLKSCQGLFVCTCSLLGGL